MREQPIALVLLPFRAASGTAVVRSTMWATAPTSGLLPRTMVRSPGTASWFTTARRCTATTTAGIADSRFVVSGIECALDMWEGIDYLTIYLADAGSIFFLKEWVLKSSLNRSLTTILQSSFERRVCSDIPVKCLLFCLSE